MWGPEACARTNPADATARVPVVGCNESHHVDGSTPVPICFCSGLHSFPATTYTVSANTQRCELAVRKGARVAADRAPLLAASGGRPRALPRCAATHDIEVDTCGAARDSKKAAELPCGSDDAQYANECGTGGRARLCGFGPRALTLHNGHLRGWLRAGSSRRVACMGRRCSDRFIGNVLRRCVCATNHLSSAEYRYAVIARRGGMPAAVMQVHRT